MRKLLIIAAFGLTACASEPNATDATDRTEPVRVSFTQEPREGGGVQGCRIGVNFQYPADMATHTRSFSIRGDIGSTRISSMTLPVPGDNPRVVLGPNGSEVFSQGLKDVYPCRQQTYEVDTGSCLSGDCRDWVVSSDNAPAVTIVRRQ